MAPGQTAPGQVTSVTMTLPWASPITGNSVSPVFNFTIATPLPLLPLQICGAATSSITIKFPAGFFSQTDANTCGTTPALTVTGVSGYNVSLSGAGDSFVLVGTAAVAAGPVTVTISGVSLKSTPTTGNDRGISIQTNLGSSGASTVPSLPLLCYWSPFILLAFMFSLTSHMYSRIFIRALCPAGA